MKGRGESPRREMPREREVFRMTYPTAEPCFESVLTLKVRNTMRNLLMMCGVILLTTALALPGEAEEPGSEGDDGGTAETEQAEATPLKEDSSNDESALRIDLYSSFEFEYMPGEGNGDPNASFDADQLDILFNYSRDRFRVAADLVWEHGAVSEDFLGNVELSFGFAEYAHSDGLVLRAGKYLTPFGCLNQYNSLKSAFLPVKLALSTNKPNKLTGNGFRFFPRRQVGLAALGSLPVGAGSFDYDLVVSNGDQEDPNPYEEDGNRAKAVTFRGVYWPSFSTGFGVSTYFDTIPGETQDLTLFSLGAQAQYRGDHIQFQTEVIYGELRPKESGSDIEQWGAFAELGYRFSNLTPYLQWQYAGTQANDPSQSAYGIIGGLNYRFREHLFMKAETAYYKGSEDNDVFADIPGRDYYEIRAALVLGF